MKYTRRRWLGRSLILGGGATVSYGTVVEKRWLSITYVDVPLSPAHESLHGLKIAVMSDFHHDDFGDSSLIRKAVHVANTEKVDLTFLLGDYITSDVSAMPALCKELALLRPRLATIGIYGNHDRSHYAQSLTQDLENAGVQLLSNESIDFSSFFVAGLDSVLRGRPNFKTALSKVPQGKSVLFARHEPDAFDLHVDPRIALQLSGHSHNGQIRFPLIGPIRLPKMAKKYPYGLYRRESDCLFVTRGIGTLAVPIRLLCRPEVAILRLVRA